jgi:hypothetical protein
VTLFQARRRTELLLAVIAVGACCVGSMQGAGAVSQSPDAGETPVVYATHDYPDERHWLKFSDPIPLVFRNQIGPGGSAPINTALADWASTSATNRWINGGPATTAFSYSYEYGGAGSCNASSPLYNMTFCLSEDPCSVATWDGCTTWNWWGASNHIYSTYIQIEPGAPQSVYNHEVGHSVGEEHATSTFSVMVQFTSVRSTLPEQHDLDLRDDQNADHNH